MTDFVNIGWETGDLSEFLGNTQSGGTLTVNAAYLKNGSYGMLSSINDGGSSNSQARCFRDYTVTAAQAAANPQYFRVWIYFDSDTSPTPVSDSGQNHGAIRWGNDTSNGYGSGSYNSTDATAQALELTFRGARTLVLTCRKADGSYFYGSNPVTFSADTWYLLQGMIDQTGVNPIAEWWYGTSAASLTSVESYTDTISGSNALRSSINGITVGQIAIGANTQRNADIWFDDLLVTDTLPSSGIEVSLGSVLSFAGVNTKSGNKSLSSTLTSSGSFLKNAGKSLTSVITSSGGILKALSRSLSSTLSLSAIATTANNYLISLDSNLGFTSGLQKTATKLTVASISFSALIAKNGSKFVFSTLSSIAGINKALKRNLNAILTFVGTISHRRPGIDYTPIKGSIEIVKKIRGKISFRK